MENERVQLRVMGIAANSVQQGMFVLLLSEEAGERYIPILLGAAEAHAVSVSLGRFQTPRPMAHDLIGGILRGFDIRVKHILIYKCENGIFYSEIVLESEERELSIDSRTSDAVSIAARFGCPIYALADIVDRTGLLAGASKENDKLLLSLSLGEKTPKEMDGDELRRQLQKAIEEENYERALQIKRELASRGLG